MNRYVSVSAKSHEEFLRAVKEDVAKRTSKGGGLEFESHVLLGFLFFQYAIIARLFLRY